MRNSRYLPAAVILCALTLGSTPVMRLLGQSSSEAPNPKTGRIPAAPEVPSERGAGTAQPLAGVTPGGQGAAESRNVYVAPFSHLDLFWAGTREEDLARGERVIAKAIRLANAHPEFGFFIESENFLADYVESHRGSQELEDLKQLVKEGRIGIAPNWANIFLNMPGGEVLARNILYGKRYAQDVFGVNPRVMTPTDLPGFTPQYPQMLREAGIPFMTMSRMGPRDKSLFNWSSPEGSKVLVWNELYGYCWGAQLDSPDILTPTREANLLKQINQVHDTFPGAAFMSSGCDLWAPSDQLISTLGALHQALPGVHFTIATPEEFFSTVKKTPDLPEVSGEIPLGWPHVVDGILQLWQETVPATSTLTTAEEFSAINSALGYADYPQREFETLWKRLIESMDHNHDGQGGEIGDNRKLEYERLAIIRGGEILRDMLRNIAERVKNPIAIGFPIVVFNGQGWQRDDVVKAHATIYGDVIPGRIDEYRRGLRLMDETGRSVPFYAEQTSDNISRAVDLVFAARGVPSLGYKTYYLTPAGQSEPVPATSEISLDRDKDLRDPRRPMGSDTMENQFYRVTVDKATGGVTVFDKQLGHDAARDMQIVGAEERGTNNVQPELNTGRTIPTSIDETEVEENNAVRTVFKISGWMADIPITQRLILYRDLKRLDVVDSLDWKSPRMIRIEQLFPLTQQNSEMYYGVPFGANSVKALMPGAGPRPSTASSLVDEIDKEAWEKYRTIQGWVWAGTPEWGVTVAADHQLVKLENGMIHGNMIRGQRYTSVKVVRGDQVTSMHFPPPGHYVFRYSLSSGPGDWKDQRSYQAGLNFTHPLIPIEVLDDISTKSLPPTRSFCSVKGDNLVISALKKAESGGSTVLRLYEIQGKRSGTQINFLGKQQAFRETDLLEHEMNSQAEQVLRLMPYEIKTLEWLSAP